MQFKFCKFAAYNSDADKQLQRSISDRGCVLCDEGQGPTETSPSLTRRKRLQGRRLYCQTKWHHSNKVQQSRPPLTPLLRTLSD